jgi:hypothetical protein
MRASWLLVGALSALSACKASVEGNVNVGGSSETADFDEPMAGSQAEGAGVDEEGGADQALLGARHDLALAGDSLQPTCTCLAVAAGFPANPAFFWSSIVPVIDADTQLVIAFTSEGIACGAEAQDSLGASYWGYRVVNDDVVVVVERAQFGRPLTSGAIIPKPAAGGAVYIEPLDAKVPYGRPLGGQGKRCRVDSSVAVQRVVPPPPGTEQLQRPPAAPAQP